MLTDMGVFQSSDVVGAVAAHERGVSQSVERRDDQLLLFGVDARKDAHVRQNVVVELQLRRVQVRQTHSRHAKCVLARQFLKILFNKIIQLKN